MNTNELEELEQLKQYTRWQHRRIVDLEAHNSELTERCHALEETINNLGDLVRDLDKVRETLQDMTRK